MEQALKARQKSILDAIIQEYIKTARPVASQELADIFKPNVSPATIRNEMLKLDDLGYLEQPHISAGRIPTDKGYRFFVDNLTDDAIIGKNELKLINKLLSCDEEEFAKELAKTASYLSGTFAFTGLFEEDSFFESGLATILEEPEFEDRENIKTFGRLIDLLNDNIKNLLKGTAEEERIFIGGENPLKEAKSCAVIISSWHHPEGFDGFLAMISPKRTNYRKHKTLVKAIKTGLNNKNKR